MNELEKKHRMAKWIIRYGQLTGIIQLGYCQNRITTEQYHRYNMMLSKAVINKAYE